MAIGFDPKILDHLPPNVELLWGGFRAPLTDLQRAGWELFSEEYDYNNTARIGIRRGPMVGMSREFDQKLMRQRLRGHMPGPLAAFAIPMEFIHHRDHAYIETTREIARGDYMYRPIDAQATFDYHRCRFADLLPVKDNDAAHVVVADENEPTVMELLEQIDKMQEPARLERVKKAIREEPQIITTQAKIVSISGEPFR